MVENLVKYHHKVTEILGAESIRIFPPGASK
jgi:hypothetical protein